MGQVQPIATMCVWDRGSACPARTGPAQRPARLRHPSPARLRLPVQTHASLGSSTCSSGRTSLRRRRLL